MVWWAVSRIVYFNFAPQALSGGAKVSFRHVEALNEMGLDAVIRIGGGGTLRPWFDHQAPVEDDRTPLRGDEILVLPEDDIEALRACAGLPNRKIVFCQNPYLASAIGVCRLEPATAAAYRSYFACSPGVAAWISRFLDYDRISVIPGFADERLFKPAAKAPVIAAVPRKRKLEARAIEQMFKRLYTGKVDWRWRWLEDMTEAEVARGMSDAAVFLSLNRLEGMALTTVEAMASGCLVAGFTGIGPRDYTSPVNGFWVEEDDCEAAARALVRAAALADADGGEAALMRLGAQATAQQWSYANFKLALEAVWRRELEG